MAKIKKTVKLITVIIALLLLILFYGAFTDSANVSYADTKHVADSDEVITIIDKSKTPETTVEFTKEQLLDMAKEEGDGTLNTYSYSAYNHMDIYDEVTDAKGVTVKKVLEEAGIYVDSFSADTKIKFVGCDQFSKTLTVDQLFNEDRYFYPNGQDGTALGRKGSENSLSGKITTPAILSFDDISKKDDDFNNATFAIAQFVPNEKNKPLFVQNLIGGTITVLNEEKAVKATTVTDISETIYVGNEVNFVIPDDEYDSLIYYTTDELLQAAEEGDKEKYQQEYDHPEIYGHIYNYDNYYRDYVKTYGPSFKEAGTYKVKIVVKHHGKLDSDVKEFPVKVNELSGTPGLNLKLLAYNTVSVSGYQTAGANHYKIYYKPSSSSSWKTYVTTETSAKIKCSTGINYSFKVRPYAETRDVKPIYGSESQVKSIKTLKKVTLTAKNVKKKSVKLTWSKDSVCSGYQIYRAYGSGKYKLVKTLAAKSTAWKNTGLKNKKTYKYKVRSYKTVDGKKVYAPYSATKSVKIKK